MFQLIGSERCVVELESRKSIKNGDSCNTYWMGMENHLGTHVDAPAHFFDGGKTILDFAPETWIFKKPFVVNLELDEDKIVNVEDVQSVSEQADIVIIKSGFYRFRGDLRYSFNNPGINPDVGRWLRKNRPHVRAVGFDFVSISSYKDRNLGREAHRAFLDPSGNNQPIFIIEDMDLSCDLNGLSEVLIMPLLVEGIDSSPCTSMGIFKGDDCA